MPAPGGMLGPGDRGTMPLDPLGAGAGEGAWAGLIGLGDPMPAGDIELAWEEGCCGEEYAG